MKRADPFRHLIMYLLYSELRKLRFKRTYRSRTPDSPHLYDKQVEGYDDARLSVQLWPDGKHRVSHEYKGCSFQRPTEFTTALELTAAIRQQIDLIPATRDRYEKRKDESREERSDNNDRPEEEIRKI